MSALIGSLGSAGLAPAQEAERPAVPGQAAIERLLRAADEVLQQVEQTRGWKFKGPVKKDVRTVEQLRGYLLEKFAEQYGDGKLERTEAWLKTLRLMPADQDFRATFMDVLLSQIGGFYDPKQRAFFMMADSARFGDFVGRMLIAHELCHALDDQYVDLQGLIDPEDRELTEDESFAIGGVVEGSATALMFAWMDERQDEVELAEMLEIQKAELQRAKVLIDAPRYFSLIAANYMVGRHFITRGLSMAEAASARDDETRAVRSGALILEVAEDPPRSTEQLLHPEKYWDPERRDEPVRVANDDAVAAAIETATGRTVVARDTLGELVVALLGMRPGKKVNLALMANPGYWTNKYSRGWGGDRMYLIADRGGDGSEDLAAAGMVWITAWDTGRDREEFVSVMQRYRGEDPGFAHRTAGRVAVFALGGCGPGEQSRDAVAAEVLERIELEKAGAPWSAAGGDDRDR